MSEQVRLVKYVIRCSSEQKYNLLLFQKLTVSKVDEVKPHLKTESFTDADKIVTRIVLQDSFIGKPPDVVDYRFGCLSEPMSIILNKELFQMLKTTKRGIMIKNVHTGIIKELTF